MKNRKNDALIATGAIAAAAALTAAAVHAVNDTLVDVALDREVPKILDGAMGALSGTELDSDVVAFSEKSTAALEALPREDVSITAADGTPLAGHWVPAESPKRIILAMHGWRGSWSRDFGMIAPFWRESGCSVLYAEQRGQNGSGGEYMGFGLTERFDVPEWVNFILQKAGYALPVYLAGVSMGATTVLMAGGLELPPIVRGIMADCGFTSPKAIWKHVADDNLHVPYSLIENGTDRLVRKKINMSTDDYSTVEALKVCKVPVLLVHGESDHFVPLSMTYENAAACASPCTVFTVPGAEHGLSYWKDPAGYQERVRAFLDFCEGRAAELPASDVRPEKSGENAENA